MTTIHIIAQPTRLAIIELLSKHGQMSSGEIARKFQVTGADISQHLRVLKEARVVLMHKQAQKRVYSLNPEALKQIEKWAKDLFTQWDKRI